MDRNTSLVHGAEGRAWRAPPADGQLNRVLHQRGATPTGARARRAPRVCECRVWGVPRVSLGPKLVG